MRRRLLFVAVFAAVATALSGCTGIPFASGVNKGVPVQDETNADIQFLPAGPAVDATPEQILRGFVEASTSPSGDWTTARQYLSAEFARAWNPNDGVIIDTGTRVIEGTSPKSFTLKTQVQANVEADGTYQAQAKPADKTFAFTFTQVSGQWRIASGPNGVIIDDATFPRVFSASPLFFFAPGFDRLVPDMRWFPAHASTTTRVVKALLDGPSEWLSATGSALTSVPRGARLVADSVPVESGVATVNFDSKSFTAGDFTAKRMLRQISSSLAGLGDVAAIDLLFSGSPQGHATVPTAQQLLSPSADSEPLVVKDNVFGSLNKGAVTALPGLSTTVAGLSPRAVSLSVDHADAAVTTASGVFSVRADRKPTIVDAREKLLPAAIDSNSFIWTVAADAPQAVRATGRAGTSRPILVPWSDATSISFLSMSPDGSRILAGLTTPSGQRVCAASISRGDDLWPKSVGPCLYILPPSGKLLSAAWIDQAKVAVLAANTSAVLRVTTLGGTFTDLTPPIGATAVMGSGSLMLPRVLTNYGELYEQSSSTRWSMIASKVTAVASSQ